MNRLFGTRTAQPKPTLDDALGNIDSRIASLDVKLSKLNAELTTYQQRMSRMRDGPGKEAVKKRARKVLLQRKQVEAQRDQLDNQSNNMQQALSTTDNLKNTAITVDAMKSANKELKKQYGKLNVDKIDQLQDEMADLIEASEELQDSMSRNYAVPEDVSESELDAELEALGDELEYESSTAYQAGEAQPSYLTDTGEEKLPTFVDTEPSKEEAAVQEPAS